MALSLMAAGKTDPGKQREINEDYVLFNVPQTSEAQQTALLLVADGMGGQLAGELASQWAAETIRSDLKDLLAVADPRQTMKLSAAEIEALVAGKTPPTLVLSTTDLERRVRAAVQRANTVVRQMAEARPDRRAGMGTTVTMAVIKDDIACIANVGDSRTYLWRGGTLRAVTRDHSLVANMVVAGQIEPDEVYTHPQRNLIYRSLGTKPTVEVDIFRADLQPGDRMLLCSDGLWELVRDPKIARILERAPSPRVACERLIEAANDKGGPDNIAALVLWVE